MLRRSCVRDIMSQTGCGSKLINFAAGQPDPSLFPNKTISRISADILADAHEQPLQYSSTEGYAPLREFITENFLGDMGIKASAEQIILTNGSQQGLDLLGKVFCDPGDTLIMDAPTYMSAIQAFELYQPRFRTLPIWEDGPEIAELRHILRRGPAKFYYTISNFHNPTGVTASLGNRRQTAKLLNETGTLLIEDDPYGRLCFDEECRMPTITSLSNGKNCVMMGTFSKILAPAFRVGWIFAAKEIISRLGVAKQAGDLCSNQFAQRIVWRFLKEHDIESHIVSLCERYRQRRDWMIECMAKFLPCEVHYKKPGGGMFIWAELPPHLSATELLQRTLKHGIAFAPGASFFAETPIESSLRINFTYEDRQNTKKGIRIIGEEIRKMLK